MSSDYFRSSFDWSLETAIGLRKIWFLLCFNTSYSFFSYEVWKYCIDWCFQYATEKQNFERLLPFEPTWAVDFKAYLL